jgi:hypothetical protein
MVDWSLAGERIGGDMDISAADRPHTTMAWIQSMSRRGKRSRTDARAHGVRADGRGRFGKAIRS